MISLVTEVVHALLVVVDDFWPEEKYFIRFLPPRHPLLRFFGAVHFGYWLPQYVLELKWIA